MMIMMMMLVVIIIIIIIIIMDLFCYSPTTVFPPLSGIGLDVRLVSLSC